MYSKTNNEEDTEEEYALDGTEEKNAGRQRTGFVDCLTLDPQLHGID